MDRGGDHAARAAPTNSQGTKAAPQRRGDAEETNKKASPRRHGVHGAPRRKHHGIGPAPCSPCLRGEVLPLPPLRLCVSAVSAFAVQGLTTSRRSIRRANGYTLPFHACTGAVDAASSRSRTCSGVAFGVICSTSAAAPAASGAEKDVPL